MILSMVPFRPRFNYPPDLIGKYVSDTLGVPVVEGPTDERPEVVFGISGHFGYCSWRPQYLEVAKAAKRFIYLCNDYGFGVPSQLKKLPNLEVWTHIQGVFPNSKYVPWAALALGAPVDKDFTREGLMYYGSYRPKRVPLFDKYLRQEDWISCTERATTKWIGMRKFAPVFTCYEDISAYEWSIYMTDPDEIAGRAISNRFFECLTAGVPLMFVAESVPTLRHFGIEPDCIVYDRQDVQRFLDSGCAWEAAQYQREAFLKRDWREELRCALLSAMGQ